MQDTAYGSLLHKERKSLHLRVAGVLEKEYCDRHNAAVLSQTLGEVYTARGDVDRGLAYLRRAVDFYRRTGRQPYLARALQSLAAAH